MLIPTLAPSSSASSTIPSSPLPTSPKAFHSRIPHTALVLILSTISTLKHPCRLRLRNGRPVLCVLAPLYEDDLDLGSACSLSSESDDFRFNMDLDLDVHLEEEAEYSMILSSSPNSDLETDIANEVEELRSCASMQPTSSDDVRPSASPSLLLNSKWSSSTIGSIHEEHGRIGDAVLPPS